MQFEYRSQLVVYDQVGHCIVIPAQKLKTLEFELQQRKDVGEQLLELEIYFLLGVGFLPESLRTDGHTDQTLGTHPHDGLEPEEQLVDSLTLVLGVEFLPEVQVFVHQVLDEDGVTP